MMSNQFLRCFFQAYRECRDIYDPVSWESLWKTPYSSKEGNWNHFMIWGPLPKKEKWTSVLHLTAEKMGFRRCEGEPFRLDCVFYPQDYGEMVYRHPLPMLVAIEHENNINGFRDELNKLAHVRCPLKVGITYTGLHDPVSTEVLKKRQSEIKEGLSTILRTITKNSSEDEGTEYLVLLGHDRERGQFSFDWYSLSFTVKEGIENASWQKI